MRTVLFVLLACALAPSAAPAAPVPKHLMPKDEPHHLYPTRVGDRHISFYGSAVIEWVVTEVKEVEGGLMVRSENERDGRRTPHEVVVVSRHGVKVIEYNGKKLDEPFWWVKLPHAGGNTWNDNKWKTAGWEDVEVPAGKFRAMRVERAERADATPTTYWWAPGIGCVKWSSDRTGRELKQFISGKSP
ncbi:MAG: hypothetical protein FJ304_16620 [Planctomycetes bacterium]|nr:hypothetical protein [Planctomycetota bacterium]